MNFQYLPLNKILHLKRRPVKVNSEAIYREIGIYSHGKGIFHKEPRKGFEVGNKKLYLIKEGDFIFQITFAWEGAIALAGPKENELYGSVRFPTFIVNKNICEPRYLLEYFKTREGLYQIGKISPGSAGRNRVLSLKRIPEVVIPLPPLEEQRRVVTRINNFMKNVREIKRLRSDAVEEGGRLFSTKIKEIYTSTNKYWPVKRIEEICTVCRGGSPRPKGNPLYFGGNIPWIKISDATRNNGKFIKSTDETLTEEGAKKSRFLKAGSLVVTNSATIGLPKFLAIDGCIHDGFLAFLDIEPIVDPEYLYGFFLAIRSYLENIAPEGTQKNLNTKIAKSLRISIPPLSIQRRIIAFTNVLQTKTDEMKKLQIETEKEIEELIPSILSKVFKGEL